MRRLLTGLLLVLLVSPAGAALALADSGQAPPERQPPLPEGTVITTQNWQQYKDYMPLWMQVVFSGQYAFKLAPDQQVVVGPPTIRTLPKEYAKNTERYSNQVGLRVLPDDGTVIQNYTAELPFPRPTNPNIGDKILWNLWYRYVPRIEINKMDSTHLIDKYHQVFSQTIFLDYQRLGHVSEPGTPIYIPEGKDIDFTLYFEIISPEESKYTVTLIIYFLDPTRIQEF